VGTRKEAGKKMGACIEGKEGWVLSKQEWVVRSQVKYLGDGDEKDSGGGGTERGRGKKICEKRRRGKRKRES